MIDELDRSLERWFRAAVPLPPGDAEINFDQPEKAWDARRSTPMVNLYLYSLNKSQNRAVSGSRVVELPGGGLGRQQYVPVVEARYLVSVWGGGPGVEHELLGRLAHLLSSGTAIPEAHQTDGLRAASPAPSISVEPDTVTSLTHLWSGLGVPPRPAIQLLVYSPMAAPTAVPVPDPPSTTSLDFTPSGGLAAYAPRRRHLATPRTEGLAEGARRPTTVILDTGREGPSVVGGSVDGG